MRPGHLMLALALLLPGCAMAPRSTERDAAAEARGYERGYRQAVKEQYWIIQNQQRMPSGPAPASEKLNPSLP